MPADRYVLLSSAPTLNWGHKTVSQPQLKGQQLDYSRGKGLGGSTAINFCCWVIGPREDFDEWADRVGDEAWSWKNVKERFKKIESYHVEVPEGHTFLKPKAEGQFFPFFPRRCWYVVLMGVLDHGTNGPLHVSYAAEFEKGLEDVFIAAEEVGLGVNPDVNSGNPIGMGMGAATMYQGRRTTAASYLSNAPPNLTIAVDSTVAKVLMSGKKATGIKTIDRREYCAKKDVVLSGGPLNSPQLLMLSGIGPADELQKHGIPIVHDLPDVGKHLQDHCFATATLLQQPGTNDRHAFESDAQAVAAARAQYAKDRSGLMSHMNCGTPMGWFKNDKILETEQFRALDRHIQEHMRKPTVPMWEIVTHIPPVYTGDYQLKPTDAYVTFLAFNMSKYIWLLADRFDALC